MLYFDNAATTFPKPYAVKKAVEEQGLLGAFTGPFTAGAAGIATALLCGLGVSFVSGPKDK